MKFTITGSAWEWRGPSPFYFMSIPPEISQDIKAISAGASYGWGAIPVQLSAGEHMWTTSIFTRDGHYIVPLKKALREVLGVGVGEGLTLTVELTP